MSNEQVLFKTCAFIASEKWWKPIISFMYTNNDVFKPQENEPSSSTSFSHAQYAKFIEFSNLALDLIDNYLCATIGIPQPMFENILVSTYEDGNVQSRVVIDTLKKTINFLDFCHEMRKCCARIDILINEAIIELTTSSKYKVDLNDGDAIAKAVTEITQAKIDQEIIELVDKGCRQMCGLLNIDSPNSTPNRKRPISLSPNCKKTAANSPRPTSDSDIQRTPNRPSSPTIKSSQDDAVNDDENLIDLSSCSSSNTGSSNTIRKTPERPRFHPPPINVRPQSSKVSIVLQSSSSYSDDSDSGNYSSASSSPPLSPASPSAIAQQTFKRTSPPYSASTSPPQSPPQSPSSGEEFNFDPAEIERRRQFYLRQRDIIAGKEHRTPPSHPKVKVQRPVKRKPPYSATTMKHGSYYTKIKESPS